MRRFFAYNRAANVRDNEQAHLLTSLLEDKAVDSVSYMITENNFDLEDLVAQLKHAEL